LFDAVLDFGDEALDGWMIFLSMLGSPQWYQNFWHGTRLFGLQVLP